MPQAHSRGDAVVDVLDVLDVARERQQDGPDDRDELRQRQSADQNPGPAEHDDQPSRHQRASVIGSARIGHTGKCVSPVSRPGIAQIE